VTHYLFAQIEGPDNYIRRLRLWRKRVPATFTKPPDVNHEHLPRETQNQQFVGLTM